MPATYDSLATTTLGSNIQTVTLSSISSAYTDLRIVVSNLRMSVDNVASISFWVNGDSGSSNYSFTNVWANGATVGSQRFSSRNTIDQLNYGNLNLSSTLPAMIEIDIFSYSGSTNKTFLSRFSGDRNGSGQTTSQVNLWRSTSAINSITFYGNGSDISAGTVISLYGILRA